MSGSPKIVCIIGPGRSGTSVLTRVLNLAGMDLGRDPTLAEPRHFNLTGLWEHRVFLDFNEKILRLLGCNTNVPPDLWLAPAWANDKRFDSLKAHARQFIDAEFGASPFWGWKDPKTTLTLPFWQSVIPDLHHLIALRNPLDMVISHKKESGYAVERSGTIYFLYTVAALWHTDGRSRLVTFYEDLLDHPDEEIPRIHKFLGLNASQGSVDQVRGAIRYDLRHSHSTMGEMLGRSELSLPLRTLYAFIYAAVEAHKHGDGALNLLLETFLHHLPQCLYRELQGREPMASRLWRSSTRFVPIKIRETSIFYHLNRLLEVLAQEGVGQLWKDMIKRVFDAVSVRV